MRIWRDWKIVILLCVVVVVVQLAMCDVTAQLASKADLRLPGHLIPLVYYLKLHPHLQDNFTIDGSVTIVMDVQQTTNNIVLHSKNINIDQDKVYVSTQAGNVTIETQFYEPLKDFYHMSLDRNLTVGETVNLTMNFQSMLSDDLEGFYRMSFQDKNTGKSQMAAATQFQATGARKAFPCFDEPAIKAKFEVSLVRHKKMIALSNMPLQSTEKLTKCCCSRLDRFQMSVPMSSYLLAFVVGDFHSTPAHSAHNISTKLTFWTRKSLISQTKFGVDFAAESLALLENYFQLKFPLPKLDFVAVPAMGPNAMENWGLVISRESGILYSGLDSISHKQWVAYLIAHELAHQWFGNIVTMKWWTDIWLNEGFATYIGYSVIDKIKPDWKIMDSFVIKTVQSVMQLDALISSPPVRVAVTDPQEIRSAFGAVAYKKGASLISMMRHFLTEKTLQDGLSHYLKDMEYKSATQDDLWKYLTAQAHLDKTLADDVTVKHIMDSWTLKAGYPVVTLTRNATHMSFSQKRFLKRTPTNYTATDFWYVPLSWVHATNNNFNETYPKAWLNDHTLTVEVQDSSYLDKWTVLNPKQTGFYRVNYDISSWNSLIRQLDFHHTTIHVINRAQILDDSFNLARAGLLDYATALSTTAYLPKEKEVIPWLAAFKNVDYLALMFRHTSSYGGIRKYLLSVVGPLYDSMSNATTSSSEMLVLRKEIFSWACGLGHSSCIENALQLYDHWQQQPSNYTIVAGDTASSIICVAVRRGSVEDWDFFWDRFLDCPNPDQKRIIGMALGCSRDIWVLKRYLEASMHPGSGISRQDAAGVFSAVAQNPMGSLLAWDYMRHNWIQIRDLLDSSMFALASVVSSVTSSLNTNQQMTEMLEFEIEFQGQFGSAHQAVEQAIENTAANVAWMQSNEHTILKWIHDHGFFDGLLP